MTFTATGICSRALVKLGADSISSFEEETTEAHIAEQLYDPTVDALLASYPWRFALNQVTMSRLAEKPSADYRYAYAIPNNCIRILSAGNTVRSSGLDYRILKNQLHTNSESRQTGSRILFTTDGKHNANGLHAKIGRGRNHIRPSGRQPASSPQRFSGFFFD